jgi:hypothetical protein
MAADWAIREPAHLPLLLPFNDFSKQQATSAGVGKLPITFELSFIHWI